MEPNTKVTLLEEKCNEKSFAKNNFDSDEYYLDLLGIFVDIFQQKWANVCTSFIHVRSV